MATTTFEPCKIRKRKKKIFGFRSFATPGSNIVQISPFRDNIRLFLQEFAEIADYGVAGMPTWFTLLLSEEDGVVFPLYIIEESVQFSLRPFCEHCKCVGWGHHFVSKRRYHLIIPADDKWDKPLKGNCLELRTHLLHGLIHCNGFGHLVCINGIEDGSNYLPQVHFMDLWDRICTTLQTRKISVNDTLKKKTMEMRLLLGVAYGQSWFGKWGYKFGRGSFGVTEHQYNRAIDFLGALELDKIVDDFKNTSQGRAIQQTIHSYRELSETHLITISDLLQFVLAFNTRNPYLIASSSSKAPKCVPKTEDNAITVSTFVSSLGSTDCRWPRKRLEYAVEVIFNLLKDNTESVMSRKDLRDTARLFIGDTGLIDFVLKSITCLAVGDHLIRRFINPSTKLVEFALHDVAKRTDSSRESAIYLSSALKFESRWPQQRLEQAAKVVWNVLRENKEVVNGKTGLSRQELRDSARQFVGDTGLIDFVLKSINGSVVENQIVCRSRNPSTKLVEFTVEDIFERSGIKNDEGLSRTLTSETVLDVDKDVLFLYRNVLFGYPESDLAGSTARAVFLNARAVLDTKHFVKEWKVIDERNDHLMTLTCRVLPSFDELDTELTRPLSPGEVVVAPPWITIRELKVAAQRALRDTYCVMEGFEARQIGGLRGIEDGVVLSCALASGAQVWVRGCGLDLDTKLRYEGGPRNWTVDCACGATDDDGERMVGCDECHVWKHTRCSNIEDDEPAPSLFLCIKCTCRETMKF
ncbi:hypothetical protein U1Q18_001954 [Sarracenia purpurea var. burkii]